MIITYKQEPIPHIIVHEFYDKKELSKIWKELEFLTSPEKLKSPEFTASAENLEGVFLKNNFGVFIDNIYTDRSTSDILTITRKLFDPAFLQEIEKYHWIFKYLIKCNSDKLLLSYYQDGGYYKGHYDMASLTVLTNFFKEPKQFDGGDLILNDYDYTIPIENNRIIIFPSVIEHSVTSVTNVHAKNQLFDGSGRYTLTHFIRMI